MKPQVISFHCVLKNRIGNVISSTFNRDVILHCPGDPMPALSEGLRNLKEGEKRQILLSASQAYGFYDPSLIIQISRKKISHGTKLKVGDQVLLPAHGRDFRVIQEDCRTVTLDGNHPLAGQDLIFLVEAVQIRDATPDEVEECRVETKVQLYH